MRMSAGRIRSINRAMARTHSSAYTSLDRNRRRSQDGIVAVDSVVPPHTTHIVFVPKLIAL